LKEGVAMARASLLPVLRGFLAFVWIGSIVEIGIGQEQPGPKPQSSESKAQETAQKNGDEKVDFEKARALFQKRQKGEKLTDEEEAYVRKAMAARQAAGRGGNPPPDGIDFERARSLMQKRQKGEKLTDDEEELLKKAQAAFRARNGNQPPNDPSGEKIDFEKARQLFQKRQNGEKLTDEEEALVRKAMAARRNAQGGGPNNAALTPRETTGMKPLSEMTANDTYQGEDGGLYGGGKNTPPAAHQRAAEQMLKQITPLDADGKPSSNGRIAFISISMSNATQEFSRFKQIADADADKSEKLTIVDCAQGGQAMAEWAPPDARPWSNAMQILNRAQVSPQQVQVAWIKLANKMPRGELNEHGRQLQQDTLAVIQNAKAKFPNLKVVYLSSRIYGGYAGGNLNPEPYAYESAYVVRWLIQDQIKGEPSLNYSTEKGDVKAPLLLWGPYLWADGTTPRAADGLLYARSDLAGDGTHPSDAGRDKVAKLMLNFFKTDPLAKSWFAKANIR
jgi:hypothetical protein